MSPFSLAWPGQRFHRQAEIRLRHRRQGPAARHWPGHRHPAAYLIKAAAGISQRRSGGSAAPAKPDEITRDDWIRRVGMFRKDGMRLGAWGPRPGEPRCIGPPELLEG